MYVNNLVDIFDEKYYRHLSGGILEAFWKIILPRFKGIYPMLGEDNEVINSENLKVHPMNERIVQVLKFNDG
jgi:hypothetical protein